LDGVDGDAAQSEIASESAGERGDRPLGHAVDRRAGEANAISDDPADGDDAAALAEVRHRSAIGSSADGLSDSERPPEERGWEPLLGQNRAIPTNHLSAMVGRAFEDWRFHHDDVSGHPVTVGGNSTRDASE